MEQEDFAVGDVVSLNSGGVEMTITAMRKDGVLECRWIDDAGHDQVIQASCVCFFHAAT